MAATIHPHLSHRPHLHLASAAALRPLPVPEPARRPVLRPIDGGQSRESLRRRRVFWRRRVVVLLGFVTAVVLAWQLLVGVSAFLADPAPDVVTTAAPPAAPVAGTTYVVQPGDTLWSIAERVAPERDPRPLVDELAQRVGSAPLKVGQRIDVVGLAG